ncbi:phage holin family protein [Lyngbya sp. CCY1209]|uniref:phage holin family protein n=1 Tax=Lyngbya sp. CCY1209 TaxID=2886103 RepID=UPI002D217FFB|nr:phage holin family protein [Lyngbya sp. CCY1209]MEB3887217.1 phage holin family protein [Lyngbya sp. CCY1209]
MVSLIVAWLVTAVSLFVIAQLSRFTGVEIDDFKKALLSSAIFGLLNAFVRPVLRTLVLPAQIVFSTFVITWLLNMVIFGLAAWLVPGFRLRWGIWSALIGAIALSFINSIMYQVLGTAGF